MLIPHQQPVTMNNSDFEKDICCIEDFDYAFRESDIYEKHEFLNSKPWIAYPTVIILFVAAVCGTVGNTLTILAFATYKRVQTKDAVFFFNLAISDLYVTCVADPMSLIGR